MGPLWRLLLALVLAVGTPASAPSASSAAANGRVPGPAPDLTPAAPIREDGILGYINGKGFFIEANKLGHLTFPTSVGR